MVSPWKVDVHTVYDFGTDEDVMKKGLFKNGPIAVAIDATPLQFYNGGIVRHTDCNPRMLDHAVLIVGYGKHDGTDIWIVKNSWAETWGINGYFMMERGTGSCGINTSAS